MVELVPTAMISAQIAAPRDGRHPCRQDRDAGRCRDHRDGRRRAGRPDLSHRSGPGDGRGDRLLAEAAVARCAKALPRATLTTPNLPEAADLLGQSEAATLTRGAQARALLTRAAGGAAEGRASERRGQPGPAGHLSGRSTLRRAAHGHAEHPRHGLHPVGGHRHATGAGRHAAPRGDGGEIIYLRRDSRGGSIVGRRGSRAGSSFPRPKGATHELHRRTCCSNRPIREDIHCMRFNRELARARSRPSVSAAISSRMRITSKVRPRAVDLGAKPRMPTRSCRWPVCRRRHRSRASASRAHGAVRGVRPISRPGRRRLRSLCPT